MRPSSLLALALSAGCATPTSGEYVFEEVVTTDCPSGADAPSAEPVTITVAEDTVTVGLVALPFDGVEFSGELLNIETDYSDTADLDAIATSRSAMQGKWVSDTTITGVKFAETVCEGADCETLGIVSCSTSSTYEATLVE